VYEYTAATTNATNAITATATDTEMDVTITVDASPHVSGEAATWAAGENVVVVDVGSLTQYTVTVTKTE